MKTTIKKQKKITWVEGSENVFADLGFSDAEERLAKAKLASKINEILVKKKLKQKEAAKLLETTQAKISLITCGHLDDFSIERLTHYLMCLNQDVDIVIRPAHREKSTYGRLKVVYV